MNRVLSSFLLIAISLGGQSLYRELGSSGQSSAEPPPQLRNVKIEQKLDSQIPLDLVFQTDTGRSVTLREFMGKRPLILSLVYYSCPRLCTMTLTGVLKTARVLPFNIGREYDVLTVSFDPDDTPKTASAKKLAYLEGYGRPGAADGWHFLIGDKRNIERLTRAAGFSFDFDDQTKQYSHASTILVLTPAGRISRYFHGIEYPPRDVRLALVEAASGKIGSAVDQFLLYCFHYDPSTGRYSMAVMRAIQTAAALSVLGLIGFIVISRRREHAAVRRVPA